MGDVIVVGGNTREGRITELEVELHRLPGRTIDRETALAWMREGHSMIPRIGGQRGPALLLLEVGDEHFIRADTQPEPRDTLPDGMG